MNDQRVKDITEWLHTEVDAINRITPLAGDASFRRYFRVHTPDTSYIAMDAPPQRESCRPFIAIAQDLQKLGINTPTIVTSNITDGFLLLSDFGDVLLNHGLTEDNADLWYQRCFEQLLLIQRHTQLPDYQLTRYNDGLYSYYEESSWFLTWYLQQYRQLQLSHQELAQLEREIHLIAKAANDQPRVVVHRDYHSRNIMIVNNESLGILDFQDAVIGPITYDLVSLLRDCYIDWPIERVHQWLRQYHQRLIDESLINVSFDQFLRWFDWIGLQRHLKCAGLFVRLNLRDNKPAYLQYVPRVLNYIKQECEHYPDLPLLKELLK